MILKYLKYKLKVVGKTLYEFGYIVLVIMSCPVWIPYKLIKKDYDEYKDVIVYQEKQP